jgi:hypothetical protein
MEAGRPVSGSLKLSGANVGVAWTGTMVSSMEESVSIQVW